MMGWYGSALIALIGWLALRLRPSTRTTGSAPAASRQSPAAPASAFEILDRRLAGGDIDAPTYQAHRSALTAAHEGDR